MGPFHRAERTPCRARECAQVLSCTGEGYTSDVIAGIEWSVWHAQTHSPRSVLSLSLGGGASYAEDQAIEAAHDDGLVVVVAAGNEGANACNSSPARAPKAVTVGATASSDSMASYSNHGTCVDILAPGSSILSASTASDGAQNYKSGTSMATPHVAGAVAQMRAKNMNLGSTQATSMLLCLATAGALTNVVPGTPNKLLYAGDVFSNPYDERAIACGSSPCRIVRWPPLCARI